MDDLPARVDNTLKDILLEAQQYASPMSLEKVNPEKWLTAANEILQGVSRRKVQHGTLSGNTTAYNRIKAQLMESPVCGDLKRQLAVRNLEQLNYTAEIREMVGEALIERFGDKDALKDVKPEEMIKMYRELSVANKLDTETLMRVRGDNVQKIEITKKDFNFEDALKQVRELAKADVIDVGDSDGND